MGRPQCRCRADPDRRSDEAHAAARPAVAAGVGATGSEVMQKALTLRSQRRARRALSFYFGRAVPSVCWMRSTVSSVLVFLISAATLLSAASVSAQMTGAPTAGYKQEPGAVSSSVPAPLREIGFDQHLDQTLPLDTPFTDEHG